MRTCEPTPFVNVYQKEIEMRLTSRSIEEGSRMPAAQSYAGGNRSPELSWRDPPEGTRSFAVTCSIRLISMMSKNSIVPFLKDYLIKFLTRPFLLDTNEMTYENI